MKELAFDPIAEELDQLSGASDVLNFSLRSVLQTGLELLFIAAVILALVFILWAGISWIISGGDIKEGPAKARARLTYAIIGLVVTFVAFFLVNFIGEFIGIELFR